MEGGSGSRESRWRWSWERGDRMRRGAGLRRGDCSRWCDAVVAPWSVRERESESAGACKRAEGECSSPRAGASPRELELAEASCSSWSKLFICPSYLQPPVTLATALSEAPPVDTPHAFLVPEPLAPRSSHALPRPAASRNLILPARTAGADLPELAAAPRPGSRGVLGWVG